MLIDKYIHMYEDATRGAGPGTKCADPRVWIAYKFLADKGVKPWEPEYNEVVARLKADGERGLLYALQFLHDYLQAQQAGDLAKLAMHGEETVQGVLEKLRKMNKVN